MGSELTEKKTRGGRKKGVRHQRPPVDLNLPCEPRLTEEDPWPVRGIHSKHKKKSRSLKKRRGRGLGGDMWVLVRSPSVCVCVALFSRPLLMCDMSVHVALRLRVWGWGYELPDCSINQCNEDFFKHLLRPIALPLSLQFSVKGKTEGWTSETTRVRQWHYTLFAPHLWSLCSLNRN